MKTDEALLVLVRLGVGHNYGKLEGEIDWTATKKLADEQGLTAVVLDGINSISDSTAQSLPRFEKLQWIGEVDCNYERYYEAYKEAISSLAGYYNQHGFKMMVLKGYACGIHWPRPEHRPYGDIDIWMFGRHKEADDLLKKQGIQIDGGLHHHTIFSYKGKIVENHFDFVNVYSSKDNREIEEIFKKLASDNSYKTRINEQTIYLPSPNLHALFLLKHAKGHFTSTCLNLRQLLDWGFFVKANTDLIDWNWLLPLLDKYHLREFFNCINAICVEDLGFASKCFPYVQFNPQQKNRMLRDVVRPEFMGDEPKWFILRIFFKYKRWKTNAWKRRMCNENNDLNIFVRSVWKHLLKPKSI